MIRPGTLTLLRTAAVALAVTLLVAACGGTSATPKPTSGGTVTFAELPATPPNYIFPMMSGPYFANANLYQFSNFMYLPLYWFGDAGKPVFNPGLSIANPPKFSDNNQVVSITMKHWQWSDGTPVTARDVIMWLNLLSAVTDPKAPSVGSSSAPGPGWGAAVPGAFPQNVVSYTQTGTYSLSLRLNASYNPTWYLYNELSQVFPLPQQAWDKLSAAGNVGNYDQAAQARVTLPNTSPSWYVPADPGTATSGALGVAQFLNSQSEDPSTFATNSLWKVVDGPFKLSQFTTTGFAKFIPNRSYSGSPKPRISAFELEPYTSDTAEFNALRSGALTIGYIPTQDLSQKASLEKQQGYSFSPWYGFGFVYFPYNYTNPTVGPIFKQLYFRQAFQSLVNQPEYIKEFDGGIGQVENGPVPIYPPHNPDESSLEANGQVYPYSPSKAVSLLRDNGWTVVPGGVSYCSKPGTSTGECGAGISANEKLNFTLLYATGSVEAANEMAALQSTVQSKAGIHLTLTTAPFSQVIGTAFNNCTIATPCKDWEMANWLGGWTYSPDYLPTGGELFATGGGSNGGDYSNPTNDANIRATHTAPSASAETAALIRYQNFLARQLPAVWLPEVPLQLTMYKSNLKGLVPQDVYDIIYPQEYYFSS